MGFSRISKVATGEAAVMQPRIVSLKELRETLIPHIGGYGWADSALNDLWLLGAPDPSSRPCTCKDVRLCTHTKRILLPNQFAKWWGEVAARTGREASAAMAMASVGRR